MPWMPDFRILWIERSAAVLSEEVRFCIFNLERASLFSTRLLLALPSWTEYEESSVNLLFNSWVMLENAFFNSGRFDGLASGLVPSLLVVSWSWYAYLS